MRAVAVSQLVCLLLAGSNAHATEGQGNVDQLISESNAEIQEQIKRTIAGFLSGPRADIKHNPDGFRELRALKQLTDDREEIIRQLAIFAITEKSEENQQVLFARLVLDLLDFPPSLVMRVLAPYLDSDNRQLRLLARDWFQGYSKRIEQDSLKAYSVYVRQSRARNREVPVAFIEYVYEQLPPGKALEVFELGRWPPQMRGSDVILAEHIVSNAIWLKETGFNDRFQQALPEANTELAKLAKHKEWWVRLYVAEIMLRHRDLRQDDVVALLSKDSDPLVAKSAEQMNRPATN